MSVDDIKAAAEPLDVSYGHDKKLAEQKSDKKASKKEHKKHKKDK